MKPSIRPIHSKSDRKRFVGFLWKIYKDDPYWAPPLRMDRMRLIDQEKNPFYKHAECQLFLAENNGEIVGRIAAIINHRHNEVHGDKVGFFGFFECINDQDVANALFDTAADWLRERGRDTMRGPFNPSVNDEIGLLVEGFDSSPVVMMTYNPRYYIDLIENYGFVKAKDLYAYLLVHDKTITPKLERVQAAVRERHQITLRNIDLKNLKRDIGIVKELYNKAWAKNWGAVPMTDEEIDYLGEDLKQIIKPFPDFAFIAYSKGVPVGFALCVPDINQVLKKNKSGRLIPGIFYLLTGMKKIDLVRILVLGVIPEYQRRGIDAVMYYEIAERARTKYKIKAGEASWVLEDNVMMNRAAELMNGERYKTYRVYDYKL
ncbi:MAG: hypothetical protein GXO82_04700 [Chlorobi bacterium]|nr:hypothetical protein [Chlorobiota bacterium]